MTIANRVKVKRKVPWWRRLFSRKPKLRIAKAPAKPLKPINAAPPKPPHNDMANRHRRHWLAGVFATGIVIAGILGSPLFAVQQVTAKPTRNLSAKQVVTASNVQTGQPLWTVWGHQTKILQTARSNNDLIQDVKVTTSGFGKVHLQAKEYRQAGYLVKGDRYYVVIENGRILHTALQHPTASYPVYGGFKHDALFATVIRQYADLPADVKRGISQIDFAPHKANPERLHLFMNDGNEVYASATTLRSKMKYYAGIASQMNGKGIINLEVGAYSYPFGFNDSSVPSDSDSSSSNQTDGATGTTNAQTSQAGQPATQ